MKRQRTNSKPESAPARRNSPSDFGPRISAFGILATALLSSPIVSQAQYTIAWHTIAGGGGTSTNSQYSLSGTIGQHDAGGSMTGGNYSLSGGFWSLIALVQTPGAPLLTITASGNSVIVSWPSPSAGFTLQQNTSLNSPSAWSDYGGTVDDNGATRSVTINSPTGNLYFRLKQ